MQETTLAPISFSPSDTAWLPLCYELFCRWANYIAPPSDPQVFRMSLHPSGDDAIVIENNETLVLASDTCEGAVKFFQSQPLSPTAQVPSDIYKLSDVFQGMKNLHTQQPGSIEQITLYRNGCANQKGFGVIWYPNGYAEISSCQEAIDWLLLNLR